jgi:hypothetical protein
VDGIWRDRPYVGDWESQQGLFGEFEVTLDRDATFDAVALALAATGKVKTYDAEGKAVIPPPSGGRRAFDNSSARSSRTAADPVMEVYAPNGTQQSGSVDSSSPENLTLDIGLGTREVPMPVSWIDFTATWEKEASVVDLRWSTASEVDNKGFEVEHSMNASQWKKIGFVAAEETRADAVANYRFSHAEATSGINYYRLKQIDRRGGFDYSTVRSLAVSRELQDAVYPNPASDVLYLSESEIVRGVKSAHLVDPTGRTIRTFEGGQSKLSLTGLRTGLYHLKIYFHDGTTKTTKVLKR